MKHSSNHTCTISTISTSGTRAHSVRRVAAAGTVAALLAAVGVSLAPSAVAEGTAHEGVSLSTATPGEVGLAGLPVEFTDTVTGGTGADASADLALSFSIDGGLGLPTNALSLEYRTDSGSWHRVPMAASHSAKDSTVFDGALPLSFRLAAGQSRAFQLRLGLPMGAPHDGDTNGGTDELKVHTAVAPKSGGAALASRDDAVAVDGLTSVVSGAPRTATAGGPGVTFHATVRNPTPSSYVNLDHLLYTNRYATVQVLRGGHWATLAPRTANDDPDLYGFTLDGKDSKLAAHATTSTQVRVTYRKDAPTGPTTIGNCVIVNEGAIPFRGTTTCGPNARLTIKATTADGTGTGTPAPEPTSTTTPTTPGVTTSGGVTSGTGRSTGQLAHTGGTSTTPVLVGAGALLLAGTGALTLSARRRTTTRRRG
ncbi:hypothetical protein [Streptomyces sp. HPF1205]|uniref:hypothetical protein n=1 Tax=Streptomyces sp. HPF1205 TaxID=2873262 RepID=UPI001CED6E6A|nr:hypothetical protein [Streptomyces sp. HPF1205]